MNSPNNPKPKRRAPWMLLAILVAIGLGTLGMCGLGGWLVVHSIQTAERAEEAGRGPLEVRNEEFHIAFRAEQNERRVELFEGPLASRGTPDVILRRSERDCDAQVFARHVGPEADLASWMDIAMNGAPGTNVGPIAIAGLDHDGLERTYVSFVGRHRNAVGFMRGGDVFMLYVSDEFECKQKALDALVLLDIGAAPTPAAPVDIVDATFSVIDNRFESIGGLVVDAPSDFQFVPANTPSVWLDGDEAVFRHENGTEVHVISSPAENAASCGTPSADDDTIEVQLGDSPSVFEGATHLGRYSYFTRYCPAGWSLTIGALGPTAARTAEALRALENRISVNESPTPDRAGHQRSGGSDWTWRNDIFRHYPSGVSWQRPPRTEVHTLGAAVRRMGYPETFPRFDFHRRDLRVIGAFWAHESELSAADYHAAFAQASSTNRIYASDAARTDSTLTIATCEGTRSAITTERGHITLWTCVHNGTALALEILGPRDAESVAFAESVIASFSVSTSPHVNRFNVSSPWSDGSVVWDGPTASLRHGALTLTVSASEAWSSTLALLEAVEASGQSGAFGPVRAARVFASTTPVTLTEVSGLAAEERRIVIEDRALRVYTVVIDATAYVISIRGPASTPESAWSELLATVHIDP